MRGHVGADFAEEVKAWLLPARAPTDLLDRAPLVGVHVNTIRRMTEALNAAVP